MHVFVHIVRSSSGSGLGSDIVNPIISKLNSDYANTEIQFLPDGYDFINNDAFNNQLNTDAQYASLYNTNLHTDAINIYVLGISTNTMDEYGRTALGRANSIPSISYWIHGSVYNTSVVSHEMGHCLGLYHTFHGTVTESGDPQQCKELVDGSNGVTCGDYIFDTPADPNIWNGCTYAGGNSVVDKNNQSYHPDPSDYMTYADYTCWSRFTLLQIQRMKDFIANTVILQNVSNVLIISGPSNVCSSSSFTFTVSNAPTGFNWTCSDGLSLSSPDSGTSATFVGKTEGSAWVAINLNNNEIARKIITVGDILTDISGPATIAYNDLGKYYPVTTCQNSGTFSWTLQKANSSETPQSGCTFSYTKPAVIQAISILGGSMQDLYSYILTLTYNGATIKKIIGVTNCTLSLDVLMTLNISPNPASADISLEIANNTDDQSTTNALDATTFNVSIVDMNGNSAYKGKKKGRKFNVSTSSMRNGIYNVIVSDGTITLQNKLIVKH